MLSITPAASEAIRGILDSPEAPDEAGIRIEASPEPGDAGETGFQLAVVPEAEAGDEVLEDGNVFLEPDTSTLLEGSELDADVEGEQVRFKLQQQAA